MWFLQIRAPGWLQTCPSHENPDVAALGTIQPHHPIGRNAPVKVQRWALPINVGKARCVAHETAGLSPSCYI